METEQNERFWIGPKFLSTDRKCFYAKLLVVSKMFGNGTKQKLLDHNFLVLIENVSFDLKFCFKNEYMRSFLERKQQNESFLNDKERWFYITIP